MNIFTKCNYALPTRFVGLSIMPINQCITLCKTAKSCLANNSASTSRNVSENGCNQTRGMAFWSRPPPCDKTSTKKTEQCPPRTCNKPKQGFFRWLFSGLKSKPEAPPEIPDPRCCRRIYARQQKEPDPDFSQFGGQAYKTCGIAYVIQRDRILPKVPCESREDRILRKIETPPELQMRMIDDDPIKDSDNLYTRLVEMADMKLHPDYKKIAATPLVEGVGTCKHVKGDLTGPIDISDVPAQIKINKSQLEKKNIYWSVKSATPPSGFEGRLLEIKAPPKKFGWQDKCPKPRRTTTLIDVDNLCNKTILRETVFDSLKQKPVDFYGACSEEFDRDEMVYRPC